MNIVRSSRIVLSVLAALILCYLPLAGNIQAQETSTTTRSQGGESTVKTEVRTGEVVYVSGNDLVVKTRDGQIRNFVVPQGTTFNVDGQDLTVHDLKPGMKLTRTITTTTTPMVVRTVTNVSGRVFYVNPPKTVILSFPDGPNKEYQVPDGTTFVVNGQQKDIWHLRKGMNISATAITESNETDVASNTSLTGQAPPPPPPTPAQAPETAGVILIAVPVTARAPQQVAQNTPSALPKTASLIPLFGLLGFMSLAASFVLRLRLRH